MTYMIHGFTAGVFTTAKSYCWLCVYIYNSIYLYIYTWGWVRTYDYQWVIYMGLLIWVWINTYENTIFSGLFTSIHQLF